MHLHGAASTARFVPSRDLVFLTSVAPGRLRQRANRFTELRETFVRLREPGGKGGGRKKKTRRKTPGGAADWRAARVNTTTSEEYCDHCVNCE